MSPEVLIYIQKIRVFISNNKPAREYFLTNVDEELFFKCVEEISQKNFETEGDPSLTKSQFENLRKELIDKSTNKGKTNKSEPKFFDFGDWGQISLN